MANSIPIDVISDTKNMIADMKYRADNLRTEADKKHIQADALCDQALRLESMCAAWIKRFPEDLTTINKAGE